MDDILYPDATIMIEYEDFSVYLCDDGFIGYCDPMCGQLGYNPGLMREEMKSIAELPEDLQEDIKATIEERKKYFV